MPRRPKLDALRDKVREMLKRGAVMDWLTVWRMSDDAGETWAHKTLKQLHAEGVCHIDRYERGESGPPRPVYRGGHGVDAERPTPYTASEKKQRWMENNPKSYDLSKARQRFKKRRSPIMDPVTAAVRGYVRRGNGWYRPTTDQESA